MNKILIVYWSGTGNTEKMATFINEGAQSQAAQTLLKSISDIKPSEISSYDTIVLGCSSMGSEQLSDEMESFVSYIEANLANKKVALFGSYGWGDGEWMRDWEDRIRRCGAKLIADEGLIVMGEPDGDSANACTDFGKKIAMQ